MLEAVRLTALRGHLWRTVQCTSTFPSTPDIIGVQQSPQVRRHVCHRAWKTAGLLLVLTAALVGGIQAQPQHEQHHPGGAQAPQPPPAETSPGVPAQPQQMQGMMERMQGMMERMQGMMERMQGMMGRGGTRDRGGMMGRQGMGMTAQGG